jgi:hypothetical protein
LINIPEKDLVVHHPSVIYPDKKETGGYTTSMVKSKVGFR